MAADPTVAPGFVDTITSGLSNAEPVLIAVGGLALTIAAGPFILKRGWALVKSIRG